MATLFFLTHAYFPNLKLAKLSGQFYLKLWFDFRPFHFWQNSGLGILLVCLTTTSE